MADAKRQRQSDQQAQENQPHGAAQHEVNDRTWRRAQCDPHSGSERLLGRCAVALPVRELHHRLLLRHRLNPRRGRARVGPGAAAPAGHRFIGACAASLRRAHEPFAGRIPMGDAGVEHIVGAPEVGEGARRETWLPSRRPHDSALRKPVRGAGFLLALELAQTGGVRRRAANDACQQRVGDRDADLVRRFEGRPRAAQRAHRLVSRRQQTWRVVPPGGEQGHHGEAAQRRCVRRRDSSVRRLGATNHRGHAGRAMGRTEGVAGAARESERHVAEKTPTRRSSRRRRRSQGTGTVPRRSRTCSSPSPRATATWQSRRWGSR